MTIRYFKPGTKVKFAEESTFEGSTYCEFYQRFENHEFIVVAILEFEDIKLKEYVMIQCIDDPTILIQTYVHVSTLVKLED